MILVMSFAVVVILAAVATGVSFVQGATAHATASIGPDTASGNINNDTGVVVSNSNQSLTGSYIGPDPSTWPGPTGIYSSVSIWNICAAVAIAEGFNRGAGAAPYDLNNPGDLSPGDESGQPTMGPPQFHGGSYIIQFATCEGGFIALYNKFSRIVSGQSSVYPKSWTWTQVAKKYAGDWQNWLNNVTSYLGVDPNSTPASYQA